MPRVMKRGALLIGVGACSSPMLLMTTLAGDAHARARNQATGVLSATRVAVAGGRAQARVSLRLPGLSCRLRASTGHHWQTLSAVSPKRTTLEWSWHIPAQARTATWHLQVTCGVEHWGSELHLRGGAHQRMRKLAAGVVRVRQSGAALPSEHRDPSAEEEPASVLSEPAPSEGNHASGGTFALSGGNCTDWAYFKRPDIYDNRSPADTNSNWDAWTWAGHAQLEGLRVDTSPETGAIGVWPATADNSSGHVAYVEAISVSGTLSFSEMNDLSATPHTVTVEGITYTYETETDSLASLEAAGVVYIHQR